MDAAMGGSSVVLSLTAEHSRGLLVTRENNAESRAAGPCRGGLPGCQRRLGGSFSRAAVAAHFNYLKCIHIIFFQNYLTLWM